MRQSRGLTSTESGPLKTEEKAKEMTAIPALLKVLAVRGCMGTIAALGGQKASARPIGEQDGILPVSQVDFLFGALF
jgi:predicted transposase YbfD/YdcC